MKFKRYAVYFGPRRHEALFRFGVEWLGTDPETGSDALPIPLPGFSAEDHDLLISAPRRYALHGTLKPPFRLPAEYSYADLRSASESLAMTQSVIELSPPVLRRLSGFFALCPSKPSSTLEQLAASCVTELDAFRAPPTDAELARRRAVGLSDRQEHHLKNWGYPYVLEDFRFHVTLTGRLDDALAHSIEPALKDRLGPVLNTPLTIRDLCLYGEPEDGGPFRIVDRFPLQSAV